MRKLKLRVENQIAFSSLLFDTLFGLILYFSIDSFLELDSIYHLIFYVFTLVIVVHWWLMFKAESDVYDEEVSHSVVDLSFGLIFLVLLAYLELLSQVFDYRTSLQVMLCMIGVDLLWTTVWRFVGEWKTKNKEKIKLMEYMLNQNLFASSMCALGYLGLWVVLPHISEFWFLAAYVSIYIIYMFETFRRKIIDIDFF